MRPTYSPSKWATPPPPRPTIQLVVVNTCPGWTAAITNPPGGMLAGMAPGEVRAAGLTVTPPPASALLGSGCHIDVQGWIGDQRIGGIRKLDLPPVNLPVSVQPPWEDPEISIIPDPPVLGRPNQAVYPAAEPAGCAQGRYAWTSLRPISGRASTSRRWAA